MVKKLLHLTLVLMLFMLVIPGCADAESTQTSQMGEKVMSGRTGRIYLKQGQVKRLTIKGQLQKVTWRSKNKKIVSVSNSCELRALSPGKTYVTAKVNKRIYRCYIVVMGLTRDNLSIKKGKSRTIKLSYGGSKVTWASSDITVAKVTKGKIKAVGEGTAVITAKAHGKTFKCNVSVPSVVFSSTRLRSSVAEGITMTTPMSDAKIYTYYFKTDPVYTSSMPSVATVSETGEVHALESGSAVITVTGDGLTYKTTVKVIDKPVDIFLSYLNLYSEFVKSNAAYVQRASTPTESFARARALVAGKGTVKVNCRAGITWAFTDMGITTGSSNSSNAIYAKNGTFKDKYTGDPLVPSNIQNYMTWITEGEVVGKTVKEAVDAGLIMPGDICCFKGRTHTFTYSGQGYKFYDGGSICEMTGYGKIGLLLDYSTGIAQKYSFNQSNRVISEILRWK